MKKLNKINELYYLLIPALIFLILFKMFPLFEGVRISFTDWDGMSGQYNYIGLNNYKDMFSFIGFNTALKNTLIYGFGCTLIQNVLGLSYALLINEKYIGNYLFRVITYLPSLIAAIIMGYMMYFLVKYDGGALNDILVSFGLAPKNWLADGTTARNIIVILNSLQFVGISMIIYMTGLKKIPAMYYEVAKIEGATKFEMFRQITLPLLIPSITSAITLNLIGGLQLYGVILSLTGGGPGFSTQSIPTLINFLYFESQNAGMAAAVGIFLFILILIFTVIFNKYIKKKEVEL